MTRPSEISRRRASHTILFGETKTGKSTLAAELLLHGFNLTWVSLDGGHEVIFKLVDQRKITWEQLDKQLNLLVIPDTAEFPVALKTCQEILSGKETKVCDRHGQASCSTCTRDPDTKWSVVCVNNFTSKDVLVIDHISQMSNSIMNFLLTKPMGKDHRKTDVTDLDERQQLDHWRVLGVLLDRLLTNIQVARYNVICIAHTTESEQEDGSKKITPFVGSMNFSAGVGKYFDHMVYSHITNSTHKFGSSSTYQNRVITGSRLDVAIEKETVPSLVKFMNGTVSKEIEEKDQLLAARTLDSISSHTKEAETGVVSNGHYTNETSGPQTEIVSPPPSQPTPTTSTTDRSELLKRLRQGHR
jgi:hypothetical protein